MAGEELPADADGMCPGGGALMRGVSCEEGFCEVDGLRFHYLLWHPAPAAPKAAAPIALLHGFAQTAESWHVVAPALSARASRPVIAFDLLGHGRSAASDDDAPYEYDAQAARVAGMIAFAARWFGGTAPAVIGYSMGGRLALGAVLSHGAPCSALVLESPGLGPRDAGERERMREVARGNARRLRELGIKGFFDWWEQLPLFATQRDLPSGTRARIRAERLAQDSAALERTLRLAGQDRMPDFRPALDGAPFPVLYLAGALDAKYSALARSLRWSSTWAKAGAHPHACRMIEGAGHDAHVEDPERFCELAGDFLADALKV